MLRAAAVSVAALAAFDLYFLDGRYIGTVEGLARSLIHFALP
jgi:hypothetical protein